LRSSAKVLLAPDGAVSANDFDAAVRAPGAAGAPPRELNVRATALAYRPDGQTLAVEGLTTEVAGVHAAWTLAGKTLIDDPTIEGSVNVVGAPLANVFDALGWQPPEGVAKSDLGDVTLSSSFGLRSEPREIRVTKLAAKIFGMELSGEGTLAGDELEGKVSIPEFAPTPAVRSFLRTVVPPRVDVGALDKLALTTTFDANVATGRAALTNLEARVFGAAVSGHLEALPGERGNRFRGSVTTSRFPPDSFVKAFAAMLPQTVDVKELGMMRLTAKFALDGAADTLAIEPFEAELFGLTASGEVTGRGVSKTPTWTGRAHIAQFSPQDLIRRFGLPPQPTSDAKALTRATIDTSFVIDEQQARFGDLVLSLDESKITGDFAVVGRDKPAYRFTLAIDGVDADRYLPPNAREAKEGEATAGDIKLPEHNTMQLDGTMRIADLRLAGLQFNDVGSRILIGNGDAKLEGAHARLYGGTFDGSFLVRAAGDTPGLALAGKASGLQLQPLIQALTGEPANLSGTGSFELDLSGRGRTVIENVDTAGGKVAFELANGAIKGFNLGALLCTAYNALTGAPGPRGAPKVTEFEGIKGTAAVTSGKAHSTDLLARTSFMDVNGRGTLGLVDQSLDYEIDAKLTGKVEIPNCATLDEQIGESIPFTLKGTVTEPEPSFDFSKFLRRKARETIQDRILRSILK
jgi:AsmA protein